MLFNNKGIINSRHLTYVTENYADLSQVTPATFLQEITNIRIPDLGFSDIKIN